MNDENIEPHRWKPGECPNPNGRPKGVKNWDVVMRELFAKGEYSQEDIVKIYIKQANDGNIKAMEWIADRMDGKAKQPIDASIDISEETKEKIKRIFDDKFGGEDSK